MTKGVYFLMMNRILLIGEHSEYQNTLLNLLEQADFDVDCAYDSLSAINQFSRNNNKYGVVITKHYMSHFDGNVILGMFKSLNPNVKTILLTDVRIDTDSPAVDCVVDRQMVLPEFLKTVYNLSNDKKYEVDINTLFSHKDDIRVLISSGEVYQNGELVDLTLKEYRILTHFLKNKRSIVTRDQLINEIWKNKKNVKSDRVIDLHVKNLRIKMDLSSLVTVRGEGYEWKE